MAQDPVGNAVTDFMHGGRKHFKIISTSMVHGSSWLVSYAVLGMTAVFGSPLYSVRFPLTIVLAVIVRVCEIISSTVRRITNQNIVR